MTERRFFLIAALLVIGAVSYWRIRVEDWSAPSDEPAKPVATPLLSPIAPPAGAERALCSRVIDGDTIELSDGRKVRYIGIDTPETKHPRKPVQWMGREATTANRILVEYRQVFLEYDIERRDKYGRTLAYVYVNGVFVNERLVRAGYAQVSTYPPNVKHVEKFLAAQRLAAGEERGLWGNGAQPAKDELLTNATTD